MSDPQKFVLDRLEPVLKASETPIEIKVVQTLEKLEKKGELKTVSPEAVKVIVDGPRLQLTPGDIAGVYPSPGSEESPDEFLPHIALTRRTLPWERVGPDAKDSTPWLALLLFKASELDTGQRVDSQKTTLESTTVQGVSQKDATTFNYLLQTLKLAPDTPLQVLYVRNDVLANVLPQMDELQYLCHVKREQDTVVNTDRAIVMCNRLPDAGPTGSTPEIHTAVLVSLERRGALFQPATLSNQNAFTALVVLHHWTFKPNQGGDFEQVVQAIKYRPNGGVLRFGNLPRAARIGQAALAGGFVGIVDIHGFFLEALPHTQPGKVVMRGPLRPMPTAPRSPGFAIRSAPEEFEDGSGELDYSHAASFEIGRLLAMADPGVLQDLANLRVYADVLTDPVELVPLPDPFKGKIDWLVNPSDWHQDIWHFSAIGGGSLLKNKQTLLQKDPVDVSGIGAQIDEWGATVVQELNQMATPSAPVSASVDIAGASSASLGKQFAAVENAAKA